MVPLLPFPLHLGPPGLGIGWESGLLLGHRLNIFLSTCAGQGSGSPKPLGYGFNGKDGWHLLNSYYVHLVLPLIFSMTLQVNVFILICK